MNEHTKIKQKIKQIKRYKHDLKSIVQQGKGRTIEQKQICNECKKA